MHLTTALAARICTLQFEDLEPQALVNAKVAILDTLGCALAGAREPVVQTLLRTAGLNTRGAVPLLGRAERLEPLCAALVNGAAAHALDFDDVNIAMGGHPTAPLLPALLALAASRGCTGRQLLLAYIAGFEMQTRLARSVNFHHYDKGWHPTATLGVFGAAAASAKLLGLDEQQTATALALCVSLASGVKANFGTMTKPYHVGHAARNGLMASLLAETGFTASQDAFEHRQGFFEVFNGPGNYAPERALEHWASPLDIVEPGIGIKLYPCCDSTHASLDALFSLRSDHPFDTAEVARIDVLMHPLRLTHVNRPQLRNGLDAKFSVQYCLARALLDGHIVLDSFNDSALNDSKALALMPLVHAAPHPTPSLAEPGNYLTELRIQLHDGQRFALTLQHPYGRTRAQPAPLHSIMTKFHHNAAKALNDHDAANLNETVMAMERLSDASVIGRLCAAG
ncbi:MmgE/PrpD family protein [Pseudomonas sp. UBA4194]|uniref:MmgE/PrpD family protein n=1 Tax=Pseudomonas sp. UBA4194 TaxID=1947317 RepID=UPI0025FAD30C|nr:MmgE/PrpD family protein [Pseudomonas sp. UBA4194]